MQNSSFLLSFVFFILCSACSENKQMLKKEVHAEKWEQLYNGKNLDDWTIKFSGEPLGNNYKNTFQAKDSFIRISYANYEDFEDKFAHMYYKTPYSNFILKFDYRFWGEQVKGGASWNVRNSGVMFHSESAESNDFDQDFPVSVEMQLLGGLNDGKERPTGNMCSPGTNVIYKNKLDRTHCISSTSKTYHGDQWISAELIVHGDSLIHHLINGDTVLTYSQPQIDETYINIKNGAEDWAQFGVDSTKWQSLNGQILSAGYISLQAESHPIDFKNLRLLDLSKNH